MTPEERQMLSDLFERIRSQAGSPRDPEAERLIGDAVRAQPYAPYLLAQTVLVQQQALEAAASQIKQLQDQVAELERNQQGQAPASGSFLGGISRSLFGSGQPLSQAPRTSVPSYTPPPPQSYGPPPNYQPPPASPWGQAAPGGGGSFLKGALGAAAGVAGGVLLADSIRSLFTSHSNPMLGNIAGFDQGYYPVEEVVPADVGPADVPPDQGDIQDVSDNFADQDVSDDYVDDASGSGSDFGGDGTIDV